MKGSKEKNIVECIESIFSLQTISLKIVLCTL